MPKLLPGIIRVWCFFSFSLELQQMLTEVETLHLKAKELENPLNIASKAELHGKQTWTTLLLPLLKEFLVEPTLGIQVLLYSCVYTHM